MGEETPRGGARVEPRARRLGTGVGGVSFTSTTKPHRTLPKFTQFYSFAVAWQQYAHSTWVSIINDNAVLLELPRAACRNASFQSRSALLERPGWTSRLVTCRQSAIGVRITRTFGVLNIRSQIPHSVPPWIPRIQEGE